MSEIRWTAIITFLVCLWLGFHGLTAWWLWLVLVGAFLTVVFTITRPHKKRPVSRHYTGPKE